jgi:hypothetical protein
MPVSHVVLRRVAAAFATWSLAAALIGCSTPEAAVQPQKTAVDALPNGIAVRPADGAVFITDDRTNSVLASTGGAFTPYASIPLEAGQGKSLSQLSFARSGALLVERFGFGTASAIFEVTGNGTVSALVGTNPARHSVRTGRYQSGPAQAGTGRTRPWPTAVHVVYQDWQQSAAGWAESGDVRRGNPRR